MNEEQVIKLMDEIKEKATHLAAAACCYIRLYEDTIKTVEKKYGKKDAMIIKKTAMLIGLDYSVEKLKEAKKEDD